MDEETLDDFLRRLSARSGDPGGGAASGVVTAIAAALGRMVCAYTPDDDDAFDSSVVLSVLGRVALEAANEDGEASAALGAALARDESGDRDAAVFAAATRAIETSANLGTVALGVLTEIARLSEIGNRHLMSDLSVASDMTAAGLGGAVTNLRGGLTLAGAHGDEAALEAGYRDVVERLLAGRRNARGLADRLGEP